MDFIDYDPKAKFRLNDRVKKLGELEVRTVKRVLAFDGREVLYEIQLGDKVNTRLYARESELEKG